MPIKVCCCRFRQMPINKAIEDDGIQTSELIQYEIDPGKRHAGLYVAALKGDWSKAEKIFKEHPDDVRAELSDVGDTVLHVAAVAGKNDFLKELVNNYMEEDDLKKTNKEHNTAFFIAAMSGDTKLAESMLNKCNDLAMICNGDGMLPVLVAALLGHEKMVSYLYEATKEKLTEEDRIQLLVILIHNDLYDVAFDMVRHDPKLAVSRVKVYQEENKKTKKLGETALHALARKPLTSHDFDQLSGTNKIQNKRMHPKALELAKLLWRGVVHQQDYYETSKLINKPRRLIFDAAKEGNIDFLSIITVEYPDLIFEVNEEKYSIFHTAVSYRHENIFKLIYEIPSIKNAIVLSVVGKKQDTILHLAAKLPPDQNRLKIVPGAALQMHRELWWFKKVSKLMPRYHAEAKNRKGKTARTVFTESHKDLMKEGEEWMKKTAEHCMLVATLIATVVFAAAITVPGGLRSDTGVPNFVKKSPFIIFAISDITSLVASACSILTFLSILTARYAEEDFYRFLPKMLLLGLFTLLLSIMGMMVVFCTTLFIIFVEGTIAPAVLGSVLASIPVMMFIWQQKRLIVDVFRYLNLSS